MVTNPKGGWEEGVVRFGYRDAQLAHPAVRFGDRASPHRLRLVGPVEQLSPDGWPGLTPGVSGLVDGPAIDAGAALVGADLLPCDFAVLSFAHPLDQRLVNRRALGSARRRGGCGPFLAGVRGFTPTFGQEGQGELQVLDFRPPVTQELRGLLAPSIVRAVGRS